MKIQCVHWLLNLLFVFRQQKTFHCGSSQRKNFQQQAATFNFQKSIATYSWGGKERESKKEQTHSESDESISSSLFHHSPLLSEEEKEEVFLASTRTFRDKNLCQSSRKFSVGYCGHSRKIFFRFYSSKTDPIKAEKAQQKAKRKKRSVHQIKWRKFKEKLRKND